MSVELKSAQSRKHIGALFVLAAALLIVATTVVVVLLPQLSSQSTSAVGGPFALTSAEGQTVTQQDLLGHPSLVFFGYTHCPDVCPATLAQMSSLLKELGPETKAKAYFVTVDPQRDTPVVLKDYMTSFDPRIVALTGTPEAVKSMERAYKVYAKAIPDKDGTYTMDHTAITYLMDKDGRFVSAIDLDRNAKDAAAELKQYF
jgi:protein SCO1/2